MREADEHDESGALRDFDAWREDSDVVEEAIEVLGASWRSDGQSGESPIEDHEVSEGFDLRTPIEPPLETPSSFDLSAESFNSLETPAPALLREQLPPPRVAFTVPAELRIETVDDPVQGAILNLSEGGLALTVDHELSPGQRFWARFRLNLADVAGDYLCVVAWRRTEPSGATIYGCEFSQLDSDERSALRETIEPRASGIATEWGVELPTQPEVPGYNLERPRRRTSLNTRWSTGAGIVAGVLIAAALGWALRSGDGAESPGQNDVAASVAGGKEVPASNAVLPIRVAGDDGLTHAGPDVVSPDAVDTVQQDAARAESGATGEVGAIGGSTDGSTQAASESVTVAEAGTPTDAGTTQGDTGAMGASPSDRSPRVEAPHVVATDDGVRITLVVDGSVTTHNTFWLENPKRFVVDVTDRGTGFAQSSYALEGPLLQGLRTGRHPDKVRFVLDVDADVSSNVDVNTDGNTVEVTFGL